QPDMGGGARPMLPPQQPQPALPQTPFSPPQPQQCQPGYTMLNGSCLPPQTQQATQTTSPFDYAPPVNPVAPTSSTPTNVSDIITPTTKNPNGTSTIAAIDLIGHIANPTTTTKTATGTPVALNGNLENGVALNGTGGPGDNTQNQVVSLAGGPTQTFVSG